MSGATLHFKHTGADFSAYHAAERALSAAGYCVGSMQRGAPTAAMFDSDYVSKWRGLSTKERAAVHAQIEPTDPTLGFRGSDMVVTFHDGRAAEVANGLAKAEAS